MTDGFFTRPGLLTVGTRRLAPSTAAVNGCLARLGAHRLDAVIPVHTHFDHALDSGLVARETGAVLVGSESAAHIGRGADLTADRLIVATSGEELTLGAFGAFEVTLIASTHSPPDRYPGTIAAPVRPPARVSAYRCGEAWSIAVRHRPSDRSLLIVGSAGWVPGALAGVHADVVYLGVGQLGIQPQRYIADYWDETVRTVGARRVVLVHWDDFFRPLHRPLRALPYAVDDLDVSIRALHSLAERDGVTLHLPTLWERSDPWT